MGCEFRRVIGMYGRILAAIDGSPASADTIGQAVRLARELDADLYQGDQRNSVDCDIAPHRGDGF